MFLPQKIILKLQLVFVLMSFGLLMGMAGRGCFGGVELKPEIRIKLYNEAIAHYEKAKALYAAGERKKALSELHKAVKTVAAFPEAHDLARQIHLELGNQKEAAIDENFFRQYGGDRGASLYRLRDKVAEEIQFRAKFTAPPDVPFGPSLLLSGSLAVVLFLGMSYDSSRFKRDPKRRDGERRIFIEEFPDEEEEESGATWLFKLCVLLLPVPFLFALLILLGVRHSSDLIPVFLFGWAVSDLLIYTIFFADFSDAGGGFRRPPGTAG